MGNTYSWRSPSFKVPDPNEARGNTVTAREILDKASSDTNAALAGDPDVQAQMMHTMARTYSNLGLQVRAHELAQRALDVRLSHVGPQDSSTLESMSLLGLIMDRQGQFADAEKLERQALEAERRVLSAEDPLLLQTMDHLAVIAEHQGRYGEAERLERDVIDVADRKLV